MAEQASASGLANIVLGAGVTAGFHPIAYAKILIQLGYEPIAPQPTTSIFGRKVLSYPNVFKYLGHVRKEDGFLGMYRGLGSRLAGGIVGSMVTNYVSVQLTGTFLTRNAKRLTSDKNDEIDGDDDTDLVAGFKKLVKDTSCEMVSRCAGVIASQPFHVIMVRSMAQFIGKEEKYSSIYSSIGEIYDKEGILGFFAGILPRLLGEAVTIWLANTLAHILGNFVIPKSQSSQDMRSYTGALCALMVTQVTYPFNLVSNIMAVNGCGLVAGEPPIMPVHESWRQCWRHLALENQLKRGSSLFWRRYNGPTVVAYDGTLSAALRPF